MIYVIEDWTGRQVCEDSFMSFEDGEDFLCEKLGDTYDECRQEYYIVPQEHTS